MKKDNGAATTSKIEELTKRLTEVQYAINQCDHLLSNTTSQPGSDYRGPATFGIMYQHSWSDEKKPAFTRNHFGMTMEEAREWIVEMVKKQRDELTNKQMSCLNALHEISGKAVGITAARTTQPAEEKESPGTKVNLLETLDFPVMSRLTKESVEVNKVITFVPLDEVELERAIANNWVLPIPAPGLKNVYVVTIEGWSQGITGGSDCYPVDPLDWDVIPVVEGWGEVAPFLWRKVKLNDVAKRDLPAYGNPDNGCEGSIAAAQELTEQTLAQKIYTVIEEKGLDLPKAEDCPDESTEKPRHVRFRENIVLASVLDTEEKS